MKNEQTISFGKCKDCGTELNEGEAKTFTVCDSCWDKAYKVESEESQEDLSAWKDVYMSFNDGEGWTKFTERMSKYFTIQRKKP